MRSLFHVAPKVAGLFNLSVKSLLFFSTTVLLMKIFSLVWTVVWHWPLNTTWLWRWFLESMEFIYYNYLFFFLWYEFVANFLIYEAIGSGVAGSLRLWVGLMEKYMIQCLDGNILIPIHGGQVLIWVRDIPINLFRLGHLGWICLLATGLILATRILSIWHMQIDFIMIIPFTRKHNLFIEVIYTL